MKKSTIALVAVLAVVIGITASLLLRQLQPIQLSAGTWFGEQARDLPAFEMIDQNANSFNRDDLLGKWHLVFFGYTHCPDICPISLQTMADMVKAIDDPDVRQQLGIMFVSVDPNRDTPQILKSYVEYFNPEFIGVTGSEANLNLLTRSIGIAYQLERSSEEQISYEVSHSAGFVLLNPAAQFAGLFGAPHDSQKIAIDLTNIIERH